MNANEQYCEFIEQHDNHICKLVEKASVGEIIDLVDLPDYICDNCARVARSDENLCRPRSFDFVKQKP